MSFNFSRVLLGLAALGAVVLFAYWAWVYALPNFL